MSSALTAAELAQMIVDINATTLPGTAIIYTRTAVNDGSGGISYTTSASGTVACRLDSITGQEIGAGGVLQEFHRYILSLPSGTSISESGLVSVGGVSYNVTTVDADKSWNAVVRCTLERV